VQPALSHLLYQVESGVGCPLTMTFAGCRPCGSSAEIADEWVARLTSNKYDRGSFRRAEGGRASSAWRDRKTRGGSDVAQTRPAPRAIAAGGPGGIPASRPQIGLLGSMCDAFLTLAQTDARPVGVFWSRAGFLMAREPLFAFSGSRTSWGTARTPRARSSIARPGADCRWTRDAAYRRSSRWSPHAARLRDRFGRIDEQAVLQATHHAPTARLRQAC